MHSLRFTTRRTARLVRAHPLTLFALGAAVAVSIASICCGVGLIASPWLACELLALLLGVERGQAVPRSRAWLAAGAVLALVVLLAASLVWVVLLGIGPEFSSALDGQGDLGVGTQALELALLAAITGLVALRIALPVLFMPLVLLDVGGNLGGALLESARLVSRRGTLRTFGLSVVANAICVAPMVLVPLSLALGGGHVLSPLAIALVVGLSALSVPLGQAWVVAAYGEVRAEIVAPSAVADSVGVPPTLTAFWSFHALAPLVALALVSTAMLRPSTLSTGSPSRDEAAHELVIATEESALTLPSTGLVLRASRARVAIDATDGGGAGTLPLPRGAEVGRVRVFEEAEGFRAELSPPARAGEDPRRPWVVRFDYAGVRTDDALTARLTTRLANVDRVSLALSLISITLLLGPVLVMLAEKRRLDALTRERVGAARADGAAPEDQRALTLAWRLGLVALLPSLLALVAGIRVALAP